MKWRVRNTLALQWIIHPYLLLICAVSSCPPMGANSFFFILNLRLFSRKKQSKVTSLEREENRDMKPHLCNMCDETFTDLDSLITHKEEHKDRKPLLCNMCGGTLMDADNFTTQQGGTQRYFPQHCTWSPSINPSTYHTVMSSSWYSEWLPLQ